MRLDSCLRKPEGDLAANRHRDLERWAHELAVRYFARHQA